MDRREFMGVVAAAVVAQGMPAAFGQAATIESKPLKPMEVGLLISPFGAPEERVKRVRDMGFSNCFLSMDGYLGQFTPEVSRQFRELLDKYEVVATTVEVVGPQPLVWDFMRGPSTIGLVPEATRRRASTRYARPRTLPSQSAFPRCRRIADLFRKIRPIQNTPARSTQFAPSPSTARGTDSIF